MLTSALFPNHRGTTVEMKSNKMSLAAMPSHSFLFPARLCGGLAAPMAARA